MGMRGGIASVAEIGLDFDQAKHQTFSALESPNQSAADEIGCDDASIALIEGLAMRLGQRHLWSIGQRADLAPLAARKSDPHLESGAGMADALYATRLAHRGRWGSILCGRGRYRSDGDGVDVDEIGE